MGKLKPREAQQLAQCHTGKWEAEPVFVLRQDGSNSTAEWSGQWPDPSPPQTSTTRLLEMRKLLSGDGAGGRGGALQPGEGLEITDKIEFTVLEQVCGHHENEHGFLIRCLKY